MITWCIAIILQTVSTIKLQNHHLVDHQGRQIIIHGTNVVVKVPNYLPYRGQFDPRFSFNEDDMENCAKWGINGIRLGVMWAGVQPSKNYYNETYLQQMLDIVNKAGQYGISTIIDFHQDLISEKFCGDGIPVWLIDQVNGYRTFPFPLSLKKIPLNSSGVPDWNDCNKDNWGAYYFTDDVGRIFNELYRKGTLLNKKFQQYWKKVASYFKGNQNVIAYEIINQPFVGNAVRDIFLTLPSVAQRIKFSSFYDQISQSIRSVDKETPICFEPINFDEIIPSGFTHPPGGKKYVNSSIYCYHYYSPPALNIKTIDYRVRDARNLGVFSLMSEFGGDVMAMDKADEYLQSWFQWNYKTWGKTWGSSKKFDYQFGRQSQNQMLGDSFYYENGTLNTKIVSAISRTYMQRTAGKLIKMNYNQQTKSFYCLYQAQQNGRSIIYINKQYNYPNGYNINIFPSNETIIHQNKSNFIQIQFIGKQQVVSISIIALKYTSQ